MSKYLGPITINVFKPGSEGNAGTHVYYLSTWMDDAKLVAARKESVDTGHSGGRHHHFFGEGLTDQEALAIVESLAPVN
jgi:hypothetical protein